MEDGSNPTPAQIQNGENDVRDGPIVSLTRIGIGAGLALTDAIAGVVTPPDDRSTSARTLSDVFGKPETIDVPMLLAAAALGAAMRLDRLARRATRTARWAGRTAFSLADLSPLHGLLARWRTDLAHGSERGGRDAEEALLRVTDRFAEVIDAIVADVVRRMDLNDVVSRVDIDPLVETVDLDRVVDRVDLNRVMERIDFDRIIDRVDVDRAIDRVDLPALTEKVLNQVEVQSIIRESTATMTDETVASLRKHAALADRRLARGVDKVLGRHRQREVDLEPEPQETS